MLQYHWDHWDTWAAVKSGHILYNFNRFNTFFRLLKLYYVIVDISDLGVNFQLWPGNVSVYVKEKERNSIDS